MTDLRNKKLALFFTCGISLEVWERRGNLSREIRPYIELAKYLDEIYFFTYGSRKDLSYQKNLPRNIRIFPKRVDMPSKIYSLLMPFFYRRQLKCVDILKTNQMSGAWAAVLTKWLYKKKLVVRCGFEWLTILEKLNKPSWQKKLVHLIEKTVYPEADKIVLTSKGSKLFVEERFHSVNSSIEIIPNYVDPNLFRPLKLKKEKDQIIYVGRLAEEKNLFNLLDSVNGLQVKLLVFGRGKLEEKLKTKAKEIKEAKLEFKCNIPNNQLPEKLNMSQIFILPSFHEGCPKALLEAMSCALPCIAVDIKEIREIIKHKDNGYLCKPDSNSIKKAILEVLEDKALQKKMGQNARRAILERFSLVKSLENEKTIYENL